MGLKNDVAADVARAASQILALLSILVPLRLERYVESTAVSEVSSLVAQTKLELLCQPCLNNFSIGIIRSTPRAGNLLEQLLLFKTLLHQYFSNLFGENFIVKSTLNLAPPIQSVTNFGKDSR